MAKRETFQLVKEAFKRQKVEEINLTGAEVNRYLMARYTIPEKQNEQEKKISEQITEEKEKSAPREAPPPLFKFSKSLTDVKPISITKNPFNNSDQPAKLITRLPNFRQKPERPITLLRLLATNSYQNTLDKDENKSMLDKLLELTGKRAETGASKMDAVTEAFANAINRIKNRLSNDERSKKREKPVEPVITKINNLFPQHSRINSSISNENLSKTQFSTNATIRNAASAEDLNKLKEDERKKDIPQTPDRGIWPKIYEKKISQMANDLPHQETATWVYTLDKRNKSKAKTSITQLSKLASSNWQSDTDKIVGGVNVSSTVGIDRNRLSLEQMQMPVGRGPSVGQLTLKAVRDRKKRKDLERAEARLLLRKTKIAELRERADVAIKKAKEVLNTIS